MKNSRFVVWSLLLMVVLVYGIENRNRGALFITKTTTALPAIEDRFLGNVVFCPLGYQRVGDFQYPFLSKAPSVRHFDTATCTLTVIRAGHRRYYKIKPIRVQISRVAGKDLEGDEALFCSPAYRHASSRPVQDKLLIVTIPVTIETVSVSGSPVEKVALIPDGSRVDPSNGPIHR
ncbi:hypothetical protein EVAR_79502_1 [Eumeta japonica]|uniref:Uncharacterized protein n=1 Tax=Eumeta variegata TaxID=151549 RepID=A0A4C1UDP1_EUMVA|nr:hypothetical protein EVAR_79502_1 [Eumeta japonica]